MGGNGGMNGEMRRIWAIGRVSMLELFRRKDMYVAVILGVVIVVPLASVNLFGIEGIVRYLREISLLLIWLFSIVIGISTAARQIPAELERRTIYPLLAKPVARREVVLGKFVGAFLASGTCLLFFYLLFVLLSGMKQGAWMTVCMFQAVLLHFLFLALLTAMALCGSIVLTHSANLALSSLVAVCMLLFGQRLPDLADRATLAASILLRAIHWLAPHFEFFDLRLRVIHGWDPVPAQAVAAATAYAAVYTALFLVLAFNLFRRKQL